MERRLCCARGRRRERGPRCQPYARHSRRQGATHELCHDLVHWRLRRPLNTTSNLDRGPLTTPKPLPAYRATAAPPRSTRLQNSCPLRNQRGQHCVHCARGITRAPVHQTNWIGDHYHPEGAARCAPIVPLPPIRNNRPLRNEGAVTANTARSQPQACAVTHRV